MKNFFNHIIKKSKIGKKRVNQKKLQKLKKTCHNRGPPPNIMELNKKEKKLPQ